MPNKTISCKHIVKNINSKLIKIKSGISIFTNKTNKHLKIHRNTLQKLNKTIKNNNTLNNKTIQLENKIQKNLTKDKNKFILTQCNLIDTISKLKSQLTMNNCNDPKLKSIHLTTKSINTMNMVFSPEGLMILYNDLL